MKLKVVLEPSEEGGYTANSKEEAPKNNRKAIELDLEGDDEHQIYSNNAEILEIAL